MSDNSKVAEKGIVTEVKDKNIIIVKTLRQEACAKCRACVAGLSEKEMFIEAINRCDAKVNDEVLIQMEVKGFLNAVILMYGVPLLFLLFGMSFGYLFLYKFFTSVNRELLSFIVGILFTAVAYIIITLTEKNRAKKRHRPVAVKVLGE